MDRGRCLAVDRTGAGRPTRRDRRWARLRRRMGVGDRRLLVTIGVALRRIHVCLRTRWTWVLEDLMHGGMGAGGSPRNDWDLLVGWRPRRYTMCRRTLRLGLVRRRPTCYWHRLCGGSGLVRGRWYALLRSKSTTVSKRQHDSNARRWIA